MHYFAELFYFKDIIFISEVENEIYEQLYQKYFVNSNIVTNILFLYSWHESSVIMLFAYTSKPKITCKS